MTDDSPLKPSIDRPNDLLWQGVTFYGGSSEAASDSTAQSAQSPPLRAHQKFGESAALLSEMAVGDRVRIVQMQSSEAPNLVEAGVTPGAELDIISCTTRGSVVVVLHNKQIGLGGAIARQILVKKV